MQAMNRAYCWLSVLTGVAVLGLASPAVAQTQLLELEKSDGTNVMQVDEDGGLVALGSLNVGVIPATGAGVRLLWWPARAVFRAGSVSADQWDQANIGSYSTAIGLNTIASASSSTAMGVGTTASGYASTAMGSNTAASSNRSTAMGAGTVASGEFSTAMGNATDATGYSSTAMGGNTTASGNTSTAIGMWTEASGSYSTAMGYSSTATADYATAMGHNTVADGPRTTAMGQGTTASGSAATAMGSGATASGDVSTAMGSGTAQAYASVTLGRYNVIAGSPTSWVATDPVLVVGNGTSEADRSNALTLLKNGDLTVAGGLVAGAVYGSSASGDIATALGQNATASGDASTAMGGGTTASGTASFAMGNTTTASGEFSTAMGSSTTAQSYASVALGAWNVDPGSPTSWVATDPVLTVGNGTPGGQANALTLYKNGNLAIAGTLTQNSDARLKTDVQPLTRVLTRLTGIRGVTFEWKDKQMHPAGRQVGLLAQEVQQAFPELVHSDSAGNLSVAYGNFTAVLLEAIKEQQQENQQLRALLADLESTVQRLQARMDATRQN